MKYKRYRLTFSGNQEVVAFLEQRVPQEFDRLKDAKARGRAAELLFGVSWEWSSVTLPRGVVLSG